MADGRCSIACISTVVKTDCNVSSRYRNDCEVRRLSDCNRPIFNHLRQFSINSADITSEGQLIAFRCGLFDTDLSSFTVCPFHRDSLGLAWQQRVKCQYPFHEGKAKPYRSFSLRMSRLVFSSLSTLVPVGSGICRKCIDLVHNLPDNHEDIKNDNDNEKNISADITQRCAAYSLRPINIENGGDCIEHSDQVQNIKGTCVDQELISYFSNHPQ
nr:uncharacterized protein LOC117692821 [Crassostrea gigas]